jgi:hypothetical protein
MVVAVGNALTFSFVLAQTHKKNPDSRSNRGVLAFPLK